MTHAPLTALPWHIVPEEDGGAWLCGPDDAAIAYVEHEADAQFVLTAVQYYANARSLEYLARAEQEEAR